MGKKYWQRFVSSFRSAKFVFFVFITSVFLCALCTFICIFSNGLWPENVRATCFVLFTFQMEIVLLSAASMCVRHPPDTTCCCCSSSCSCCCTLVCKMHFAISVNYLARSAQSALPQFACLPACLVSSRLNLPRLNLPRVCPSPGVHF